MEKQDKKLVVTFRIFQAIFLGIFALGLSSVVGDISKAISIPVSAFSITTTLFGLIGAIITGIFANKCKDW